MKTNAPLFLVALGLFVTGANAAQSHLEADVFVLPTYVVRVPRYQPFEKQIKANLREACQQAQKPLAVTLELSLPAIKNRAAKLVLNLPDLKTRRETKS